MIIDTSPLCTSFIKLIYVLRVTIGKRHTKKYVFYKHILLDHSSRFQNAPELNAGIVGLPYMKTQAPYFILGLKERNCLTQVNITMVLFDSILLNRH